MNNVSITVTILDNDTLPILSVSYTNLSVFEREDAVINIRLSHPTDSEVTFNYSTTTGTATSADFTEQRSTQHTFGSGTTDTFSIPIVSDEIVEVDETFTVSLSNLSGATFSEGNAPAIIITILDDDLALISIADSIVDEPDSGTVDMEFVVSMSSISSHPISVSWTTLSGDSDESVLNARRGIDFAVAMNSHTGTVEIPAGLTSRKIRVPVSADNNYEFRRRNFYCYFIKSNWWC